MKAFLDRDFLLQTEASRRLYHEYAADLPIIDYHNHLPPDYIARNHQFENLTSLWLQGDHYKWRAMRANGVPEHFITGDATDREKFRHWAATVPYTVRNPLYHWTHLELQRYFGISTLLSAETADIIYDTCNEMLSGPEFRVQQLLERCKVEVVCTTDDPADSLEHHRVHSEQKGTTAVYPAFRPDAVMQMEDGARLRQYLERLSAVSNTELNDLQRLLACLRTRHDHFARHGCRISDHGLENLYALPVDHHTAERIFSRFLAGEEIHPVEVLQYKSFLLHEFATWDHEKNWVQQFHVGALRNNNRRMLRTLGPDTGWDSIGDFPQAKALSDFLDNLDAGNQLAKTILYNLNPADNEVMATMIGNFNDGSVPGKMQWGSAWWFLDQKDGMIRQLNTLSNMGLLSRFVGMLTDSRSFLSFPRHEYFRRILCDLLGKEMEAGELPDDFPWIGKIVQDVCYYNARSYFGFF
ncbi:glucuronate isomerase [Flavihumibacter petaseus]|uniref:Uronate isomerase n=1 Tax=Flavihumibacter petaseus NBRC 106054 TaxID=1220578 RepID=A0A0E9N672_9BACT|nr:glucuronate isomerase [Flavihumibacter petaseus]GAO44855.1 uronate isomerase [Flavihumibacter petaseus NBRC 106054]